MSLLMKALEKAAKDRVDARPEPAAAAAAPAAPASAELSLEPLVTETPAGPKPGAAPRKSAAAASREQARATTVLQAAARPAAGRGVAAYVRAHPLLVFGMLAGLFGAGFAAYVYLQISQPGLLVARPPLLAKGPPPAPAPAVPPATTPPTAAPLPAAPLLQESASEPVRPEAAQQPKGGKPQPVAPAVPPAETPRNTIVVSRGSPETTVSPVLTEAYAALQSNQLDSAQRLYDQLLRAEPRNIDALLGVAAIAVQRGDSDEATRRYLQILGLDPRHALAQSGLIGLLGRTDPLAAESRLKQLIAREPSAFLYFTLGNLYADQSLWAPAQQAYFQAYSLEPVNPDYAYNLAVGLEHVSQPGLALGYYRRAVQLAAARGRVNFNLPQAQERISKLARQVE